MDCHYLIVYDHDILHTEHRKQGMKASEGDVIRRRFRVVAFAPLHELGVAARNARVVAPGVEHSHRYRGIRIPEVKNAVLAGMGGEKLAQLRDDDLCAVECCPLDACKREHLSNSKSSQQKNGTRFAARPER